MSPLLKTFLGKRILIVTTEGECLVATLEGFDKYTNLLLSNIFDSNDKLVSMAQVLRGSEIVLCGMPEDNDNPTLKLEGVPKLKNTKNKIADEYLIWEAVWKSQSKN